MYSGLLYVKLLVVWVLSVV